uniref:AT-hook-containing transcription factor n=1 Tax=Monopterus albus TaxID=43700 RepID=UPI0009B415BC|nr:AT-hook-containing transcription factor [Monopterus albus]
MEMRKNTKAGVLFWTPAPARTSPTSSVMSEEVWEDEDREQAEDDFVNQMDENGIIGLSETLENVELGSTCVDAEYSPAWCPRCLTPEQAGFSGHKRDKPPEELSYNWTEHLSVEDLQIMSPCNDMMDSLKSRTVNEEVKRKKEHLPENDKYLDMTEDEEDGDEVKRSDGKRNKNEQKSTSGELGTITGLAESCMSKGGYIKINSTQSCGALLPPVEPAVVSIHHHPVSQSVSGDPTFPHLLHFTPEELAAAQGIEAETFPEMDFTESLPESHSSHMSCRSSPRCLRKSESEELEGLQAAAPYPEQVMENGYTGVTNGPLKGSIKSDKHHKQPSLRNPKQPSPEATYSRTHSHSTIKPESLNSRQSRDREPGTPGARTKAAGMNESSKAPLSYRTPDFSKVEPRVRFPKGGYKPPKSKYSSIISCEPPLVYKSPADIVKEVLLDTTDGSPAPPACNSPPDSAPNSTVPQEFRCRQQAATLLDQLQEDYNKLLTKYAEAENTIDRLRLEAKVNLYSDFPKPSSASSALNYDASKFMTLNFPQVQKAETSSASLHLNEHSAPQSLQLGQELDRILYSQAGRLLQQLQTFRDLLQREKLKPFVQMKGLSQLAEELDSLERGYLLARDANKRLQKQQGAKFGHFDPERELEGLIYQCGLHMDELREQVEQMQQEQPTCEGPPSPPPHPIHSSVPTEEEETLTHTQSPPVLLLVDPGGGAKVDVSFASEESDTAGIGRCRHVEQDFAMPVDHYQSYKELPKMLDHRLREGAVLSAALGTNVQPGDEGHRRRAQGSGNMEVQESVSQRIVKLKHQDSLPAHSRKFSPTSLRAPSQSTTFPVHPPTSCRSLVVGKSYSNSLSSLGEITASERRNSKLLTGSMRVLSQDGIISPETDSGFVGSESSRLTPAAVSSPFHQRAPESSVSVHQEGNTGKPQTSPISVPSRPSSPPHSCTTKEPRGASQLSPEQPRRSRTGQRKRKHTFFCSPQHWVNQTEETRANSGSSEIRLGSDSTHTVSDDRQSDQYPDSTDSLHSYHSSSSSTVCYHHGDCSRGLGFSQVANHNDAVQMLQAEVTRLKGRLEGCLRNKKPLSSATATPSAQENYSPYCTSAPFISPGERQSDTSVLLYMLPLYTSPINSTGTPSGVKGHGRLRTRPPDTERSLNISLNRAIRAARNMRHTSSHMARSLSTGLQYQELLTQSCSY